MLTSIPDLLIVGGAALLVFGPKRLPELAKSLGKGIRDFKRAVDGLDEDEKEKTLPPSSSTPLVSDASRAAQPISRELKPSEHHS